MPAALEYFIYPGPAFHNNKVDKAIIHTHCKFALAKINAI